MRLTGHKHLELAYQLICRIRDRSQTDDEIYQYLVDKLPQEDFSVWLAAQADKPVGIVAVELFDDPRVGRAANIAYAWVMPGSNAAANLYEVVEQWARNAGARALTMITSRNPLPFIRRYGFYIQKTFLAKELK